MLSVGLSFLTVGPGGADPSVARFAGVFTVLVTLPLFIFPAVRFLAWLNRVAVQQASAVDVARVTVWIRVFRFFAGLGLVSGILWAISLILISQPAPGDAPPLNGWSIALLTASSVGSFNLLGVARGWVHLHTANQHEATRRSEALSPLLPRLTGWIRVAQALSVLSVLGSFVADPAPGLSVLTALTTLILAVLILKLTLHFAQVSARPTPDARTPGPA